MNAILQFFVTRASLIMTLASLSWLVYYQLRIYTNVSASKIAMMMTKTSRKIYKYLRNTILRLKIFPGKRWPIICFSTSRLLLETTIHNVNDYYDYFLKICRLVVKRQLPLVATTSAAFSLCFCSSASSSHFSALYLKQCEPFVSVTQKLLSYTHENSSHKS